MSKSRYKNIDVSCEKEREKILIMFKERNLIDAKWLTVDEAQKLADDLEREIEIYTTNEPVQK